MTAYHCEMCGVECPAIDERAWAELDAIVCEECAEILIEDDVWHGMGA